MTRIRNPMNIKMVNGKLTDKYGRTFTTDWKEFDKLRGRRNAPVLNASKLNGKSR